jgi:NADH-quinone oxidoreductase subunit M
MLEPLMILLIAFGIVLMAAASAFVWRQTDLARARRLATGALALNFIALLSVSLAIVNQPDARLAASGLAVDALNAFPLALFAALVLGVAVLAPKRKLTPQWFAGLLWLCAAMSLAYAADNLIFFVLGWAGSLVPFLWARVFARPAVEVSATVNQTTLSHFAQIILSLSLVCLGIGVTLLVYAAPPAGLPQALSLSLARTGEAPLLLAAFGFLMTAAILRKGIFPAHSWVAAAFEQGPLLPLTLLVNGHLGAYLVARIVLPLLPDVAQHAWSFISYLSLFTSLYAALLGLVARNARRLFALVAISQSAFLLTGLESNSPVGIAGALVLWQVVAVSTTLLAAVYAGLEARLGAALEKPGFLGLALNAPRLAVFFAVGGLALVGLPLTLGFPAEDLLLQGTLAANPWLGIVLPVVTAMNAFSVVRLFARLFLGKPVDAAHELTDALPRERWMLAAALLFLVLGGLFPATLIHLPALAAERIVHALTNPTHTTRLP